MSGSDSPLPDSTFISSVKSPSFFTHHSHLTSLSCALSLLLSSTSHICLFPDSWFSPPAFHSQRPISVLFHLSQLSQAPRSPPPHISLSKGSIIPPDKPRNCISPSSNCSQPASQPAPAIHYASLLYFTGRPLPTKPSIKSQYNPALTTISAASPGPLGHQLQMIRCIATRQQ